MTNVTSVAVTLLSHGLPAGRPVGGGAPSSGGAARSESPKDPLKTPETSRPGTPPPPLPPVNGQDTLRRYLEETLTRLQALLEQESGRDPALAEALKGRIAELSRALSSLNQPPRTATAPPPPKEDRARVSFLV